ncbi:hypothetical protein [Nocardia crassostreae]|uniref:hypothetical protein n=1 Tax=Nocardia crassostreae TaxID=53428 RepID=UPI000832DEB3|nr:hypothetical protein [Nocardia crassostreae]
MRSITTGAVAVALAATVATAGPAWAEEPAPERSEENISVDVTLLGCSIGAGLGGDLVVALAAGRGSSATIQSGLAARLRAAGCLPWT